MKRITSILLILAMVLSSAVLVGCVENTDQVMKEAYLRQFNIKDKGVDDVIIDYDLGMINNARIIMLDAERNDPEEWTENIGDVEIRYFDSNRLLVYRFGWFFTLSDAKKLFLLTDEQISHIAGRFTSEVGHFRDTCDKNDFGEYYFWDNFDFFENVEPLTDVIAVRIDMRVFQSNYSETVFDVAEYLGSDIVKDKYQVYGWLPDSVFMRVYICNEGYENMPYIFERLSQIPGVLEAGYYYKHYDILESAYDD